MDASCWVPPVGASIRLVIAATTCARNLLRTTAGSRSAAIQVKLNPDAIFGISLWPTRYEVASCYNRTYPVDEPDERRAACSRTPARRRLHTARIAEAQLWLLVGAASRSKPERFHTKAIAASNFRRDRIIQSLPTTPADQRADRFDDR